MQVHLRGFLPHRYDITFDQVGDMIRAGKKGHRKHGGHRLRFHAVTWKESGHQLFNLYMPFYSWRYYEKDDPIDDDFLRTLPEGYCDEFEELSFLIHMDEIRAESGIDGIIEKNPETGPLSLHIEPRDGLHRVYKVKYRIG